MQGCGQTPPPCQLEKIVSCGYGATRRGRELARPRARLIGANTNTSSGSCSLSRVGSWHIRQSLLTELSQSAMSNGRLRHTAPEVRGLLPASQERDRHAQSARPPPTGIFDLSRVVACHVPVVATGGSVLDFGHDHAQN
jgi:hypothetical protein